MPIVSLDISNFRNIHSAKLKPLADGFNLIYGDNGSGKTSVLESIYYLSLGRSFRCSTNRRIIRDSADKFSVTSTIKLFNNQSVTAGVSRHSSGEFFGRLNNKDISSISELTSLLPVQLINSSCYSLLDSGPIFRRKYMDWGAFYLFDDFLSIWKQYKRVLKQRNAALIQRVSRRELLAWTDEFIESAIAFNAVRQSYVFQLLPILTETISNLIEINALKIDYYPGWDMDANYKNLLLSSLDKDLQLGYTQIGPHKANFNVTIKGLPAKDILSRGQQKLFVCAMIIAQGILLYRAKNRRPIYLIDDLPSELDIVSRSNLITLLSKQEAQIFVTAVEKDIVKNCLVKEPVELFHVEHGEVREMSHTSL